MLKRILALGLLAVAGLAGCAPGARPPTSPPTDASGMQQAYEAAVTELGVDYVSQVSLGEAGFTVVGHSDLGSDEAVTYNLSWGTDPLVSRDTVLAPTPAIAASEIDFGERYMAARSAMAGCAETIVFSVGVAPDGSLQSRGSCGVLGQLGYATLGDLEWTQVPDFSTEQGAGEILKVLDALGADQLNGISVTDGMLLITSHDQTIPGPGGQCAWQFSWSATTFDASCPATEPDKPAFAYAGVNRAAFPAAMTDVYAHSGGLVSRTANVEWRDEAGAAVIYTLIPPDTVYGYQLDGTPLQ